MLLPSLTPVSDRTDLHNMDDLSDGSRLTISARKRESVYLSLSTCLAEWLCSIFILHLETIQHALRVLIVPISQLLVPIFEYKSGGGLTRLDQLFGAPLAYSLEPHRIDLLVVHSHCYRASLLCELALETG